MPALTIWTSRFSDTAGTVAEVQFASERKSYSSLTVQCGLKPYSRPAPTSQPSFVLDPFQVWPKAFTSAVLCTQPPPSLPYTSHWSSTTPTRAAAVPIQCWLTEPRVGNGSVG